jgi:hypothetical protein
MSRVTRSQRTCNLKYDGYIPITDSFGIDRGVGDYRPERVLTLYPGGSSLVNSALHQMIDDALGASLLFLVIYGLGYNFWQQSL